MVILSEFNFLPTFFQSIITSIVAAFIFLFLLFFLRPRIKISNKICKIPGKNLFIIKIVNKSFFRLYDVNVELVLLKPEGTPGGQNLKLVILKLKKDKIWFIPRYKIIKKKSPNASYAVQFTCTENIYEKWDHLHGEILQFKIIAKHGLSSFVKIKTKKFHHKKSDIIEGEFGHGNDCEIVAISS